MQTLTLSAPAPRTMILKMKSTLSQTFPMTEEWDWTLSSREDRKPHSPMMDLTKQSKCKSHLCRFISISFYFNMIIYYR